jgi:DNA-directed RNA polymerase subunit RPC12/RpoP
MGRVRIGDHLWLNLSRRSLCDNCVYEVCTHNDGGRVEDCPHFVPAIMALKLCCRCGEVYEVSSNFKALDYELCPVCNSKVFIVHV